MKKNSTLRLLLPILFAIAILSGCKKDDGPIKGETLSLIDAVPAITTNLDATGSQSIDLTDLASFNGKFKVSLYFKDASAPEKVDIVVRKNAGSIGNANVKVFAAGVTSLPANYSVTSAALATLFGAPIALGDSYDFSADIYANGKKYEAFPAVSIGTAGGPRGMPGYSEFARFSAICAYNPNIYKGNFVVITDEWADYSPGAVVPITQVSANQFSFIYGADNPRPIIVTVNTANNETSVAKQVYGDGYGGSWPYGPISCQSIPSTENFVAPCDGEFSVRMKHTVAAGSFGDMTIKMKKQ